MKIHGEGAVQIHVLGIGALHDPRGRGRIRHLYTGDIGRARYAVIVSRTETPLYQRLSTAKPAPALPTDYRPGDSAERLT